MHSAMAWSTSASQHGTHRASWPSPHHMWCRSCGRSLRRRSATAWSTLTRTAAARRPARPAWPRCASSRRRTSRHAPLGSASTSRPSSTTSRRCVALVARQLPCNFVFFKLPIIAFLQILEGAQSYRRSVPFGAGQGSWVTSTYRKCLHIRRGVS